MRQTRLARYVLSGQADRISQKAQRPPRHLQAEAFAAHPALSWWYRLAAPKPPTGRVVTLRDREHIRRSRLASIILAVQLIAIELPAVPVVLAASNHNVALPWLFVCIVALLVAFVFNRKGNLTVAALLMVASIEVTMILKIIIVPGGIGIFTLPQFGLLIQPILISVALLAPWSAFVVAAFNIFFVIAALSFGAHAPDLIAVMRNPAQAEDVLAVPIMSQILTSFFCSLIVTNLIAALKQADQAEKIAELEASLAESQKQAEVRSTQLEEGVDAIVLTIQRASSNKLRARIKLPNENVLWPIAMQLNLFLERYERARNAEGQLYYTGQAIQELANEIYNASQQQRPLQIPPRRNTMLDAVLAALKEGA